MAQSKTSSSSKGSSHKAGSMAELMASHGQQFQTLNKGDIVEGKIKKLTPQEILLEIAGKSDALVIEYDKKNLENLLSLLSVGDQVKAAVISPESEEGFPVVSLRRTLDDLIFSRFEKIISADKELTIQITDGTKGGFFAETDSGVKGFLPNSQLLGEPVKPGDSVKVKVVEFDKSKKRVIFSQKATKYESQVSEIGKLFKEGQEVTPVVQSVTPYGIFVEIEPKKDTIVEGFIHISEVSYERVENLEQRYSKGDSVTAQVLGVDTENRRVNLSIKQTEKDTFEGIEDKYKKEQKVKATVKNIVSRGVTLQLEEGIDGFIPAAKVPTESSYKEGDTVEVEVTDYDKKRRLVLVSPVLKAKFVGYR